MKHIIILNFLILFAFQHSDAATCRDMKKYHRFNGLMCTETTAIASKMKDDVDASVKAAEQVVKQQKHEIYEGQLEFNKQIANPRTDLEIKLKSTRRSLRVACMKNTYTAIIDRLERAEKRPQLVDRLVSLFEYDLIDKMNGTNVNDKKCMEAIFQHVEVHNQIIQNQINKNQISDYKCIHQQNCAPSHQSPGRNQ